MYAEIIPAGGVGRGAPIRVPLSQIVVYQDNGTPIIVAGDYGPDNSQVVSTAWEADFNLCLRNLRIPMTVMVDTLQLPAPPPGARLVSDPRKQEIVLGRS